MDKNRITALDYSMTLFLRRNKDRMRYDAQGPSKEGEWQGRANLHDERGQFVVTLFSSPGRASTKEDAIKQAFSYYYMLAGL